jgi:SAM-dependent methyltransferase
VARNRIGHSPLEGASIERRACLDLFLISFLILFFELAAIRWFSGTVVFLTFFTNIVLLACFLGMSVGLLAARRSQRFVTTVLPLAVLAFLAAIATHLLYLTWAEKLTIELGSQQLSPQLIYFGTEYRPADPTRWLIPMWAVAGGFFALIAVMFVGLGQVMGRAFDSISNRVMAYSVDVLGSLTGIAAFAAMSYFQLSPAVWFLPVVLLILYFSGWRAPNQLTAGAATLVLVAIGAHGLTENGEVSWSPYYKVSYLPDDHTISTNDIGHQQMQEIDTQAPAYMVPYLLNRDAGGRPFEEVMIIGAGSGNDVAAALRAGPKHVDAVEIDPRINELGRRLHPDKPYADPRVAIHLDDGRSFARHTERKYDLAVYALVDSLVLHSGYSSLRLENFLFTREALADLKRTLKPDGIFVMYNYYRQGWVVGRLAKMAEEVFDAKPLVISLPHKERIAPVTTSRITSPSCSSVPIPGGWKRSAPDSRTARASGSTPSPPGTGRSTPFGPPCRRARARGIRSRRRRSIPAGSICCPATTGRNFICATARFHGRRSAKACSPWRCCRLSSCSPSRRCGASGLIGRCSSSAPASCCSKPRAWCIWHCSSAAPGW